MGLVLAQVAACREPDRATQYLFTVTIGLIVAAITATHKGEAQTATHKGEAHGPGNSPVRTCRLTIVTPVDDAVGSAAAGRCA
jgi:hypothetical protein